MAKLRTRTLVAAGIMAASTLALPSHRVSADVGGLMTSVATLASDDAHGRVTGTPGAELARSYIQTRLFQVGYSGRVTTQQTSGGGTNVLASLPGTGSLANEYVLVGAHYDHVPLYARDPVDPLHPTDPADPRCTPKGDRSDFICNGASDNAAGVAVLLDIAEQLVQSAPTPRRGVYFAFWDREESDFGGSIAYRNATLPPYWPQPVVYINYDVQGTNLMPSLRSSTFAIAAGSGGDRLSAAVAAAAAPEGAALEMRYFTEIFGQYRSDYATFLAPQLVRKVVPSLSPYATRVPSVFLSDSNGRCYHTTQDEFEIIDFDKLARQARTGVRLVRDLITGSKPTLQPVAGSAVTFGAYVGALLGFTLPYPAIPPPSYADAKELLKVAELAEADPALGEEARATIETHLPKLQAIVARPSASYKPIEDGVNVAVAAVEAVRVLQLGECDGFLQAE